MQKWQVKVRALKGSVHPVCGLTSAETGSSSGRRHTDDCPVPGLLIKPCNNRPSRHTAMDSLLGWEEVNDHAYMHTSKQSDPVGEQSIAAAPLKAPTPTPYTLWRFYVGLNSVCCTERKLSEGAALGSDPHGENLTCSWSAGARADSFWRKPSPVHWNCATNCKWQWSGDLLQNHTTMKQNDNLKKAIV